VLEEMVESVLELSDLGTEALVFVNKFGVGGAAFGHMNLPMEEEIYEILQRGGTHGMTQHGLYISFMGVASHVTFFLVIRGVA
jgi:hypothetical protein